MADDTISEEIAANALRPQSTTVDGEQITERSLADQIAADKYIRSNQGSRSTSFGLRFGKIVPPGAT